MGIYHRKKERSGSAQDEFVVDWQVSGLERRRSGNHPWRVTFPYRGGEEGDPGRGRGVANGKVVHEPLNALRGSGRRKQGRRGLKPR